MLGYRPKASIRTLILFAFLIIAALAVGYYHSDTAQSQNTKISLNSPVSFPVDI